MHVYYIYIHARNNVRVIHMPVCIYILIYMHACIYILCIVTVIAAILADH